MNIVFMGTPDFSVPVLEGLIKKHNVVAVYTRAPKECGRGKKINKTPIHLLAEQHNIPVRTPVSLKNPEEQEILKSYGAELAIVAAYGLLLPQAVLDMFPLGCINVHASLLPRWRGAAPIERAVESGDSKSGITIMKMALALDAGDMLAQREVAITKETTGGSLHDELSTTGASLLLETLDNLANIKPVVQDESLVCYAKKIEKAELELDFNQPTQILDRKIKAFSPYPCAYFSYNNERFKIYQAIPVDMKGQAGEIIKAENELIIATSDSALNIKKIQRQGKQPMLISELLRGFKFEKGSII